MNKLIKAEYMELTEQCNLCSQQREHYCFRREPIKADMIIIQDRFSDTQKQEQSVFAGNIGNLIRDLLIELNVDLEQVYITAANKCDGFNPSTAKQYQALHNFLLQEILAVNAKPKLIVCLGSLAICILSGRTESIKKLNQAPLVVRGITLSITYSLFMHFKEPSIIKSIKNDMALAIRSREEKKGTEYVIDNELNFLVDKGLDDNDYIFALDIETTSLLYYHDTEFLLTFAISDSKGKAVVVNYGRADQPLIKPIARQRLHYLLMCGNSVFVGHNVAFDYKWLRSKFLSYYPECRLIDTRIMYIILDENAKENTLKSLSARFTDAPHNYNVNIDTSNLANQHFEELVNYNAQDADFTLRLYHALLPIIQEQKKEPLLYFMCDALKVLADIEFIGVKVDLNYVAELSKNFRLIIESFDEAMKAIDENFNPRSTQDLANLLYEELDLPIPKLTDKGAPSVDGEALESLLELDLTEKQSKTILAILEYKKVTKIYSTYLQKIPKLVDGSNRIHTSFNLGKNVTPDDSSGTVTGRVASKDPNLQNIPIDFRLHKDKKEEEEISIRAMFVASEGYLWLDADYSQLELRVAAWFAGEQKMLDIFREGRDLHTSVLSQMLSRPYDELIEILKDDSTHPEKKSLKATRVVAKSLNFGILYGAGAGAIQRQAKKAKYKITKQQAQDFIDQWLNGYPKIKKWIHKTQWQVKKTGVVSSPTGRERHLEGALIPNSPSFFAAMRQSINFPVQTLASEMCLAALIVLDREIKRCKLPARLILTVHDSISIEVDKNYAAKNEQSLKVFVKKCMTTGVVNYFQKQFGFNFDAPLDVSITIRDRWS